MTQRFGTVSPNESVVLTFEFALALAQGETLTGTPTVLVTVDYGTDGTPEAIVVQKQISGTAVLVSVSGMSINTDYHFEVECPTSNAAKVPVVGGILPVRRA